MWSMCEKQGQQRGTHGEGRLERKGEGLRAGRGVRKGVRYAGVGGIN